MRLEEPSLALSIQGMQVKLSSHKPAVYVMLTTAAHGRFSDNCFLLVGERYIDFIPFMDNQEEALRTTTRVEHLHANQQMQSKHL